MESKIKNLEAKLFPTGYLVELAIKGVAMGLLETDSLEIAQKALKQPRTFISQSVLKVAIELAKSRISSIPHRHRERFMAHGIRNFDKTSQIWEPHQLQWNLIVEESLAALIVYPEQPPIFWNGAVGAARLLQPVNWGHPKAEELVVLYKLSQAIPLTNNLEQILRKHFDFNQNIELISLLPVGVALWSFGYGAMQLCRHAHENRLSTIISLLEQLQYLLEQEPLKVWVEVSLAELPQLHESFFTKSVCLLKPGMTEECFTLNKKQLPLYQELLEGTKTLKKYAIARQIDKLKKLGYELHNHPSMLFSIPRNHASSENHEG